MKKLFTLAFIVFISIQSGKLYAQGSTFSFTNTGTTPQIDSAITFTGNIWGQYLNSAVPIKVHLYYLNLFGTTLAITIPNGRRDFPSAIVDSVWYPSCLANAMEGTEINVGEDDMNIFFDSSQNWYFGTDANCPGGKYDFVTTLLHEIGHGLGFLSLSKMENDSIGSFGTITSTDLAPLVTTFPFPILQGKHSIFSHYMENAALQSIVDTVLFPNNSVVLGDQFISNGIYFKGPLAMAANGGSHVRLFAPTVFEKGSSMEHLNESTFPSSNPNSLMTPYLSASTERHTPGPITIGILEDIGWNVNHDVGFENMVSDLRIEIFPNPVENFAFLRLDESIENEQFEVIDMYGRMVLSTKISVEKGSYYSVDLSQLTPGIYTVRIKDGLIKLIKN